jgi:heat shock protein HslJ
MKKCFLVLTMVAVLAASCSAAGSPAVGLDGTAWELLFINKSEPIPGRMVTIEFENGEVRGSAGCNSYFGSYEVKGNVISFGMLAMTEMACLEPEGLMEQEQAYLQFLSEVETFALEGERLMLKKAVQEQLTFIPLQSE